MDMTDVKVCPLLSIRGGETACLEEECALYLAGPKKCSLVFLGYRAMLEVQQFQQGAAAAKG